MNFHLSVLFVNLILSVLTCQRDGSGQWAERAIQLDREPVTGQLEKQAEKGVIFRSTTGAILTPDHLRRVENINLPQIAPGTTPAHSVRLWGNESISGVVQGSGKDHLELESLAGDRLTVPLAAIQKVVHFQGESVVIRDDFEESGGDRRTGGEAKRTDKIAASGRWALILPEPNDQVEYRLAEPLLNGWFETRFWDNGALGLEWFCEIDFESPAGRHTLQVILGSEADSYALATPNGPALPVQRIARRRGWNRLAMRFSNERISLMINDAVLTHRAAGIGSLQAVRFVQSMPAAPAKTAPETDNPPAIDDVQISATLAAPAERQPARDQDDLLLVNGDQFYGQIVDLTRESVTIQSDLGTQTVAWRRVHEINFSPRPARPRQVSGQRVRIEFVATATMPLTAADYDALEGVLQNVSRNDITVEQPFIGPVRIRRDQMRSLEFHSAGQWIAIDPGFFHFGEQVDVRLQVPHPGGTDRSWQFELKEAPSKAQLILYVMDILAMPPGSEAEKRAGEADMRTYAAINGVVLDTQGINSMLPIKYRSPIRLSVPIPPSALKPGENVLRIYQTASTADSRTFDDCGIFGIALEVE